MQDVSVIIPNYNGKKYLKRCLDAMRAQTLEEFEVILVDNGSSDGSLSFVREEFPEVICLTLAKNYGFCKAVNAGVKASHAPFVILLNNDTEAAPDMLEVLVNTMRKNEDVFSASAKMLQMADPGKIDNAGDFYTILGWAYPRGNGMPSTSYQKEEAVFSCCAAAAIYRRDLFEKIGMLDEHHFAYLEDVDLGWRARLLGYRNLYVPDAVVLHAGSGTTGSRHNEFKVTHAAGNNLYMIFKNMPFWQKVVNAPWITLGILVKAVYFSGKDLGAAYRKGLRRGLALRRRFPKKTVDPSLRLANAKGPRRVLLELKLEAELIANMLRLLVALFW